MLKSEFPLRLLPRIALQKIAMTRRRWIADEISGTRAAITGDHARHLSRVLRVRVGEKFDIVIGNKVREGVASTVADSRVEFELGDEVFTRETPAISLALAIFKFDRMEWAIEKCTELGAKRIIPLISERTDPHLAAAAGKRVERWRRIALQASEQSRRATPAEVLIPMKLKGLFEISVERRILLSESERNLALKDAASSAEREILLAIGPEGGWTDSELVTFHGAGWTSASLGNTILRSETAAIAAVAIAAAECQ